jgi:hypothetical protein
MILPWSARIDQVERLSQIFLKRACQFDAEAEIDPVSYRVQDTDEPAPRLTPRQAASTRRISSITVSSSRQAIDAELVYFSDQRPAHRCDFADCALTVRIVEKGLDVLKDTVRRNGFSWVLSPYLRRPSHLIRRDEAEGYVQRTCGVRSV